MTTPKTEHRFVEWPAMTRAERIKHLKSQAHGLKGNFTEDVWPDDMLTREHDERHITAAEIAAGEAGGGG